MTYEDDGGIFADTEDNWETGEAIESANPLITQAQDDQMHSQRLQTVGSAPSDKVHLVAEWDGQGRPWVARTIMNDSGPQLLEQYRKPSPDEYNAIMFGKNRHLVRGGVVAENVPTSTNLQNTLEKSPLGQAASGINFKKLALYGGIGVAALGAGWFGWKKWRERG